MHIIKLHTTASTNTALRKLLSEGELVDGSVVWTDRQSQGRGQAGKTWISEPGKSLTFSIFKKHTVVPVDRFSLLNMHIALSLRAFLQKNSTHSIQLKWPNDILSDTKKIAGILVENSLQAQHIKHSIIGIGINLLPLDTEILPKAAALMDEKSIKSVNLEEFLVDLVKSLWKDLQDLEHVNTEETKQNYLKHLYGYQSYHTYQITANNVLFKAKIIEVDHQGRLVLLTENDEIYTFENQGVRLIS